MNKKKIILGLSLVLAIIPLIITLIVYNKLPDQIPINWGIDGSVTYSAKANIWWLAIISLICYLLFLLVPKLDPKKKNFKKFSENYYYFILFFSVFMIVLFLVTLSETFNPGKINVVKIVPMMVGLLFIFLGNIMPKFKSNYFIGIKNPWTLSDEDVWNKTHRLGGLLFFIGGALLVILTLFTSSYFLFVSLLIIAAIIVLIPTIMSYIWYKQKNADDSDVD